MGYISLVPGWKKGLPFRRGLQDELHRYENDNGKIASRRTSNEDLPGKSVVQHTAR
jgi:hypothetical protein